MRIAILMHGASGNADKYGTGASLPVELSHKHFQEKIVDVNKDAQIDVFMHSWSPQDREQLVDLYKPLGEYFEPQIIFDFEYIVGDPNGPGGEINKWHDGKFKGLDNLRFHALFSRWYSAKIVNELRLAHQAKNGFVYDYVMLTRYDLAYIEDFDFSKFEKSKIYAIPPMSHHGLQDLWFIGSHKNMDALCQIYDWIKRIDHFPGKFAHSHWLLPRYLQTCGLLEDVSFFGSERPWDMGVSGRKLGASPLIRDYYDLAEQTPDSDMSVERERIKNISNRTLRW